MRKEEQIKNSVGEFNNERKSNRFYKKRYGIMRGNDTCNGIRFFVKPTLNYVNYIDFRVLGILLSLMTVMAGLQRNGLFDMIGSSLLKRTKIQCSYRLCWSFYVFSLACLLRMTCH